MTFSIPFTKMHGLGNDFIVISEFSAPDSLNSIITPEFAKRVCHRRFGIGADQILWLKPPHNPELDIRMDILNADGSIAEMCGNGIRAVALYLNRHSPVKKSVYRVETLAGIQIVELVGENEVRVDMGRPRLGAGFEGGKGEGIEVFGATYRFFEVSMGNPHAVIFVDHVSVVELEKVGPQIETHSRFPKRTNVEFVEVTAPDAIQIRVWERGAGVTLACGTGACAAAVAAIALGKVSSTQAVKVSLPGGVLKIEWKGSDHPVIMQGTAEEVFHGTINL